MTEVIGELIYVMPFCLAVSAALGKLMVQGERGVLFYAAAAALSAAVVSFGHLKTKTRIIAAGIPVVVILGLLAVCDAPTRDEWTDKGLWVMWVLIIAIASFLFERIVKQQSLYRLIAGLLGVMLIIVLMLRGVKVEKMIVIPVLAYVTAAAAEELDRHWVKERNLKSFQHVVFIYPFLLAAFILLTVTKVPDKPYDWGFVKKITASLRTRYEIIVQSLDLKRSWDSKEAAIGFSGNGGIAGSLRLKPYTALKIALSGDNAGSGRGEKNDKGYRLYLEGKSFDTFDGRSWAKNDRSDTDYKTLDLFETCAAVLKYDPDNVQNYIKSAGCGIETPGIRTSYVFTPFKALPSVTGQDTSESGGDVRFSEGKALRYTVSYYRLNRSYEGFEAFAGSGVDFGKAELERAGEILGSRAGRVPDFEELIGYRNRINELYCEKPKLSAELRDLMDSELSGAQGDYEKLKRIEKLLSGLQYTLSPGELPEKVTDPQSFLDYVILEKKGGYCTHFATAFVLLARAEGIPARYVQGYSAIVKTGKAEIASDRAHAWPEAYIKGPGWLGFEPSPGFLREYGWETEKPRESTVSDASAIRAFEYEGGAEDKTKEAAEASEEKSLPDPKLILLPLAFVLLFILLFAATDRIVRKLRYSRMNEREKLLTNCRRNLRLLRRFGISPGEGETLSELKVRAGEILPSEMLEFIGLYEELSYSPRLILPRDISVSEACGKKLFRYYLQRFNPLAKGGRF